MRRRYSTENSILKLRNEKNRFALNIHLPAEGLDEGYYVDFVFL